MADDKLSRKRKLNTSLFSSQKKLKSSHKPRGLYEKSSIKSLATRVVAVDELPWKSIRMQDIGEFGDSGGAMMMDLEEVDGVDVVYEENENGGKTVGFRLQEQAIGGSKEKEQKGLSTGETEQKINVESISIEPFDSETLPSWKPFHLHPALLHSIHKRGFTYPTPIQQQTLDIFLHSSNSSEYFQEIVKEEEGTVAIPQRRDIVGIAQTGSGKTLAYGLPILHHILSNLSSPSPSSSKSPSDVPVTIIPPKSKSRRPLQALILAPTRELALQVSEHLNACLEHIFSVQRQVNGLNKGKGKSTGDNAEESASKSNAPPVSVAAIVGGMSAQKQRRILSRGADILVATPGRFWDLCGEDAELTSQVRRVRFLVLDEADRMVEAGHFQELDNILRLTQRPENAATEIPTENLLPEVPVDLNISGGDESQYLNDELQTFVFSATMSKRLQRDLKRPRKNKKKGGDSDTLDDLLRRLDFRDPNPVVIDLSPQGGKIEGLQESKVECLVNDKDYYLYYFLLRHTGRSLVFLSSIDGIRRLLPILEILKINAWPLHSGLQQKQRLKNLDRFKSNSHSVLLATDIAARGLDIPSVDHVVHYQVPRSADSYVHRNGRTARANQEGFGLVLCGPDERRVFKGVMTSLGRAEDDVPELNVDHDILDKLKHRVQLSRKIDSFAHRTKKENHDKNWLKETAEAMEIELDSDFDSDDSDTANRSFQNHKSQAQVAKLKAELKDALAQPLVARGISMKYITSGSKGLGIIDGLIAGEKNQPVLGMKQSKAGADVVKASHKKSDKRKKAQK